MIARRHAEQTFAKFGFELVSICFPARSHERPVFSKALALRIIFCRAAVVQEAALASLIAKPAVIKPTIKTRIRSMVSSLGFQLAIVAIVVIPQQVVHFRFRLMAGAAAILSYFCRTPTPYERSEPGVVLALSWRTL
jgi:hypothetical protein